MQRKTILATGGAVILAAVVVLILIGRGSTGLSPEELAGTMVSPNDTWSDLVAAEASLAPIVNGEVVPAELANVRFDEMTKAEWNQLRADILERLSSQSDVGREGALQSTIFLAIYHKDRIDLDRANVPLYDIYNLGRDETQRIMALAAMHAIGHRNTMAHVAQDVKLEASPKVKRLSAAAVVDFFRPVQPSVKVDTPQPVAQ